MGWRFHIDLSAPLSNYSPHLDSPFICGVTDDHIALRVDGQTVHATSYFGVSLEPSDCAWTILEKDTQSPRPKNNTTASAPARAGAMAFIVSPY
jgi:hypothetical protein